MASFLKWNHQKQNGYIAYMGEKYLYIVLNNRYVLATKRIGKKKYHQH